MMKDLNSLVFLEYSIQLYAIPVKLGQVKRSKVLVVSLVCKNRVDIKEEAVRNVFGRLLVAVPVKTI